MKKVVWGVLSTAKIGREKVIPAMQAASLCDMHAIASRSLERAQHVAGALGIPVAYGSYEELFADPAIEAIYNPLPNDQHVALTLQAARAGKHVLCEKPLALDANQAAQLREVATRVHIMEAFMVRFHPQPCRPGRRRLVRYRLLRGCHCALPVRMRTAARDRAGRPRSGLRHRSHDQRPARLRHRRQPRCDRRKP